MLTCCFEKFYLHKWCLPPGTFLPKPVSAWWQADIHSYQFSSWYFLADAPLGPSSALWYHSHNLSLLVLPWYCVSWLTLIENVKAIAWQEMGMQQSLFIAQDETRNFTGMCWTYITSWIFLLNIQNCFQLGISIFESLCLYKCSEYYN